MESGFVSHLPPLMWETLGQGVRSPAGAQFQTSASVPTVRPYVADDFFFLSYRLPVHGSSPINRCSLSISNFADAGSVAGLKHFGQKGGVSSSALRSESTSSFLPGWPRSICYWSCGLWQHWRHWLATRLIKKKERRITRVDEKRPVIFCSRRTNQKGIDRGANN